MTEAKQKVQQSQAILRHWRDAVPDDRFAHLVKDAGRGLSRALQMRLTEHSVSFGHWTFLRILWVQDGLTQRELSERAGLMEPTTFSALKAMEQLGYVIRRQQPDSRKKVYVFLTETGHALRDKLVPLAEEVNKVALEGIDPATISAARDMLLKMIHNLAQDEAEQSRKERRMPSTRQISSLLDRARKPARPAAQTKARGKARV